MTDGYGMNTRDMLSPHVITENGERYTVYTCMECGKSLTVHTSNVPSGWGTFGTLNLCSVCMAMRDCRTAEYHLSELLDTVSSPEIRNILNRTSYDIANVKRKLLRERS